MNNRINVLYITTKCNLECDYCYEEKSRKRLGDIVLSYSEIREFLEEVAKREKGNVSTIVVMGGEPFMYPNSLYFTLETMRSMDHKWGMSIATNMTLISKDLKEVKQMINMKGNNTSLTFELSYDCSGHFRRPYRGSTISSRKIVEKRIQAFVDNKIPFKISYVLNKDTYENFIKDYIYIVERFGTEQLNAIKLSPFCQELSETYGDYKKAISKLEPYVDVLIEKYGVPVCDICCGKTCFLCDKTCFIGKSHCGPAGISYEEMVTERDFNRWDGDK